MDALRQILSAPGDHWTDEVQEELGNVLHFNHKTIDKAKARLKVRSRRAKKPDGKISYLLWLDEEP